MDYLSDMNYDQYKLSNSRDEGWNSDLVTSCCGCEAETRLIEDELISTCIECNESFPDMIEEYEYEEKMKEWYAEMYADERRDLR